MFFDIWLLYRSKFNTFFQIGLYIRPSLLSNYMVRFHSLILIFLLLISCNQNSRKANLNSSDPCAKYGQALNGVFTSDLSDGTMTWVGGIKGEVDIQGAGYNDMTCTYEIVDCVNGNIDMLCVGSGYQTKVIVFSADSIELGDIPYYRME